MFLRLIVCLLLTSLSLSVFAADPLRLALNWKAEPQFGGFYTASNEDLFKKAGLDVKIMEGGSGTPTVQMLAAGQTDYAVVSADEVILAHDRGISDVIAIFASFQTNPQAIMVHPENNYKTLSDLLADSKATLQWQAGLPYAMFLKKKTPNFSVKTAPYTGGIAGFQHDQKTAQQCFATSEPLAAQKAKIPNKVFLVADAGYNPYTTVLVTKVSRLKDKPDEVKKMVQAVREGWTQYLKDSTKTNTFMGNLNKAMNASTFAESAKAQQPLMMSSDTAGKGLGAMTEERWKTLTAQLLDLGLIKKAANPADLFRNY